MGLHIDRLYNEFVSAKEHILTEEAFKSYKVLSMQWKVLTKDLSAEEKVGFLCLRSHFEDFLNICCKDHFTKGFESGINVAYELTDKYLGPIYDALDDEEDSDNI